MNEFDFKRQLAMSHGVEASGDISAVLLEKIPGALKITRANERDDRSGTDYWIEHTRGTPISVDCKVRDVDPVEKRWGDDLLLETWSIVPGSHSNDDGLSAIGWTLDEKKRTDYILWWFKPTKRWVLIPFAQLCSSFKKRKDNWLSQFPTKTQTTNKGRDSYRSEVVTIPREVVWNAIYEDFGGAPAGRNHALRRHGLDRETSPRPLLDTRGVVGYTRPEHTGERAPIVIGIEPAFLNELGVHVGDEVSCSLGAVEFTGLIISNTLVRPSQPLPRSSTVRVWRKAR